MPNQAPVSRRQMWINWAAASTLVSILFFLWQNYRAFEDEHARQTIQLTSMQAQIEALHHLAEQTEAAEAKRIDEVAHRLDLQRADIATIQERIATHLERGR